MNSLPLENAHGGEGRRRLVLRQNENISPYLEVFANTLLPVGGRFSWHKHDEVDEIMVCLSGNGTIQFETGEKFAFVERDLICIPKGISHTIFSPDNPTEYFFIRLS